VPRDASYPGGQTFKPPALARNPEAYSGMTRCIVCGASLEGRRRHARTCSPSCRREASRLRAVLSGRGDGRMQPSPMQGSIGETVQNAPRRALRASARTPASDLLEHGWLGGEVGQLGRNLGDRLDGRRRLLGPAQQPAPGPGVVVLGLPRCERQEAKRGGEVNRPALVFGPLRRPA
jgi:hypothetical protein